jgi:hypothetical protein
VEDNLDPTATSESSDTDLLNDEEVDTTPPKEAEPPKSEDLVDPDEEEEEEEETPPKEEEEEENPEEENKITRPSWNELKAKYPGIEKNKELREVYFREKAFSDIYSNVDEAKDASEKARILEFFDSSLSDGTPDALLSNLNPQALEGFAEKILPSLRTANKDLFIKATAPVLIDIVNNINESAIAKGDKNLETSVLNVCKWLFGDFKIPSRVGNVTSPEIEKEKRSLQETREKLISTQRMDFTSRVEKSIGKQLDKLVREGLETDNPFLTDTIVEKTLSRVRDTITSDKEFLSKLSIIYKQAEKSGYPSEYAARVISAYLGRAKGIALKARAEIKSTALGKQSTKPNGVNTTRKVVRTEKGNGEVGKSNTGKVDMRSTRAISDLDILNRP